MNKAVLIIDDEPEQCALLADVAQRLGYASEACASAEDGVARAIEGSFHVVLLDLGFHGEAQGIDICRELLRVRPGLPVIVVTGDARMTMAVEAMRAGASDYVTKPVDTRRLEASLTRVLQRAELMADLQRLTGRTDASREQVLVGRSAPMQHVALMVERVAASEASVLIQGETGTGKELVAHAIHAGSPRAAGPFVALNCASMPPALLESELFGHGRGAFTDAKQARAGLFVEATGGTLFLDEVGEMPLEMQSKLLRALQERTVRPVGTNSEVPFDARILSATHRDLEQDVQDRRFRQDLFYRLNVVSLSIPPLRARPEDILPMAAHFLERFAMRKAMAPVELTAPVAERLLTYPWPGNVRELENCMERLSALARFQQAAVGDLPDSVRSYARPAPVEPRHEDVVPVAEFRRRYIMSVLEKASGNKSRAAQMLHLDRRTLYRKLDRYKRKAKAREELAQAALDAETDGGGRNPSPADQNARS